MTSRKKILWLCSWYPDKFDPFNGDFIQRHANAAARYNDIHIIYVAEDSTGKIKNTFKEIYQNDKLTEYIVYCKKNTSFLGKYFSHLQWLFIFKKAIRNYIVENGKPDLIHVQVPMKAGILALWAKKYHKVQYVITEHWGIYNEIEEHNYQTKNWIFKKFTKKIFSSALKFISVSKFLAEGVNKLVVNKEYIILPNTVNTDLFNYKEKKAKPFRFIHISNMVPLKNAEGILRSFQLLLVKYPDAELVMVGNKDLEISNYAIFLRLSHNKVSFRGEIKYEQVAVEMQKSDCFLLFSNIENSPCVLGEALCCGVPVIASAVGGVPELVNNTNSILVETGNENQLAEAMLNMINDYNNYDRKKIAEDAKGKFSYPVIGKKLDEIYTNIISGKD